MAKPKYPPPTPHPTPPPPSRLPTFEEAYAPGVLALQSELNKLQAELSRHLTRAQRSRGMPPKPKAVARLKTGGLGVSYITPVGGATEAIAKGLRMLRFIPQRGTEISLKARTHVAGVPAVFRHETAHQLLRSQGVPQRGENVVKKVQLPHDVPPRQFYGVVEQVGRAEKTPTREQRRRLSQMRQRVMFGRQRRKGRGK